MLPDARPLHDVAAIISIVAAVVGSDPTFASFATTVTEAVGTIVPPYTPPTDGWTLYAAADELDIANLAALGSR